jgi:hypothetical protein
MNFEFTILLSTLFDAGSLFSSLLNFRFLTLYRFTFIKLSNSPWAQTAKICLSVDLSTVGGLAAGTLQLIGWVSKMLEFATRVKLFQL